MKSSKKATNHENDSLDAFDDERALKKKRALYEKHDRALSRVLALCQDSDVNVEELNKALDILDIAHTSLTFNFASGSFSS